MGKKSKFKKIWTNQTELGKMFNMSAISIGKFLIEKELKDKDTKQPTEKALKEGYALSTPLKDGTPFFMWNKQKVKNILSQNLPEVSKEEFIANDCIARIKEADRLSDIGEDKFACFIIDDLFEEVPKNILEKVKEIIKQKTGRDFED